ncbi:MAG: exonuclease domain-containing protein [Clostridia bacterium]
MLQWIKNDGEFDDLRFRGATLVKSNRNVIFLFSNPKILKEMPLKKLEEMLKAQEFGGYSFKLKMVLDKMSNDEIKTELLRFLKKEFYGVYVKYENGGYYIQHIDADTTNDLNADIIGELKDTTLKSENNNKLLNNTYESANSKKSIKNGYKIIFKLDDETNNLFEQMKLLERINSHFEEFTATSIVAVTQVDEMPFNFEEAVAEIDRRQDLLQLDVLGRPSREIEVKDVEAVIGKKVVGKAQYIMDLKEPKEKCIICGKIISRDVLTPKNTESKVKFICKLKIEDMTGTMSIVHFCKESEPKEFNNLNVNDTIIVFGKADFNGTGNFQEMQVMASNISKCTINNEVNEQLLNRKPNDNYLCVTPQPYKEIKQKTIFDVEKTTLKYLREHDIVVFDLETTGLKPLIDKIIEIGAVKIHNGIITEYFETLVNPACPIPMEASNINNIYDDMVKNSPKITSVIGDFYKFCYGCTLVSHNIPFDFGFLQYFAKGANYVFNNEKMDTLVMAREHFAKKHIGEITPRDFKLKTLASIYNIEVLDAHRAFDDARVAAELFIKLLSFK